ncbi:unnamed protein product [Musa acuminata subsp. malaccensis]|uniref:(wild Malaysian banana) hypothetical protein n=1 Tax=Musa acuminata subsp. malaccensis TaxID=214687 RepID=A0A804ICN3_MUSAM|nr:unnamed protein product [Musa acuminata subsp. malaccensis]
MKWEAIETKMLRRRKRDQETIVYLASDWLTHIHLRQDQKLVSSSLVRETMASPAPSSFMTSGPPEKQQELIRSVFTVLSGRPDNVSNFVEADAIFGSGTRLVYKHLATLYFVFVFDGCENELPMLDLSQVPVETLDRCFKNVGELDIVFNFNKKAETGSTRFHVNYANVDFLFPDAYCPR